MQALQGLLKDSMTFMSSSESSKSKTCINKYIKLSEMQAGCMCTSDKALSNLLGSHQYWVDTLFSKWKKVLCDISIHRPSLPSAHKYCTTSQKSICLEAKETTTWARFHNFVLNVYFKVFGPNLLENRRRQHLKNSPLNTVESSFFVMEESVPTMYNDKKKINIIHL